MQEYGVNHWVLSQREYHEDVAWCGDFDIIVDPFLRISHLHGLPCTITRAPCDTLYLVSVIGAGNIRFLARFTSSGARSPTRSPSTPGVGDPAGSAFAFFGSHSPLSCAVLLTAFAPHMSTHGGFFFLLLLFSFSVHCFYTERFRADATNFGAPLSGFRPHRDRVLVRRHRRHFALLRLLRVHDLVGSVFLTWA